MSEHYYGNVPAGWEPEVCCVVKDTRIPGLPPYGALHTCFEPPNHTGPHVCGHHHSSTHFNVRCNYEWESTGNEDQSR